MNKLHLLLLITCGINCFGQKEIINKVEATISSLQQSEQSIYFISDELTQNIEEVNGKLNSMNKNFFTRLFNGKKKRGRVNLLKNTLVTLNDTINQFSKKYPLPEIQQKAAENSLMITTQSDNINRIILPLADYLYTCNCDYRLSRPKNAIDTLKESLFRNGLIEDNETIKFLKKRGHPTNKQGVYLLGKLTILHNQHLESLCHCICENFESLFENLEVYNNNLRNLGHFLYGKPSKPENKMTENKLIIK